VCQLTLNATEAPAVSGTCRDVIFRNFPETVSTNDKGMVAFYVAVPVFSADDRRGLRVSEKGKHTYRFSKFTTQSNSDGGRIINSIVAIPKPIKYVETKGLTTIDYGYGTFVPETGVFWAPVDCGYDKNDYKCGKLYQFGRMDGCGYYRDASATNPPQDAPNKIIQSLVTVIAPYYTSSPAYDKFYGKPSEDTFDWYTSDKYEQMLVWPVEKSENMRIGNPCPDGWRVPTCDELSSLIGGASKSGIGGFQTDKRGSSPLIGLRGLFFDGTAEKHPTSGVFLTAAGYRHRDDGSFLRRGMTGNYWSSSPSSTNPIFAGYLNFNENEAYIVSDGTRANGYSVRCVQE